MQTYPNGNIPILNFQKTSSTIFPFCLLIYLFFQFRNLLPPLPVASRIEERQECRCKYFTYMLDIMHQSVGNRHIRQWSIRVVNRLHRLVIRSIYITHIRQRCRGIHYRYGRSYCWCRGCYCRCRGCRRRYCQGIRVWCCRGCRSIRCRGVCRCIRCRGIGRRIRSIVFCRGRRSIRGRSIRLC